MKTISRFLFAFIFLSAIYSCSNDDKNTPSTQQQNYTTNSVENQNQSNYYLIATNTRVGTFSRSGFEIATNIIGKYIQNDAGDQIRIDSIGTLDTKIPHFNYLTIYGSSPEKDSEGKDIKVFYHIAFPIFDEPNYKVTGCPSQTHTCKSASAFPYRCSHCAFDRDDNGCITGCHCADENGFTFGQCEHSVTTDQGKLNLSLRSLF